MEPLKKESAVNEVERIVLLAKASPTVRVYRLAGYTWIQIAEYKTCNPLGLSTRQLQRIYSGPAMYDFDVLKRVASGLDREPAKPKPPV